MLIVNLKTRMRSQPGTNQWGQMSGSWSAFFSSLYCVRACVINNLCLWASSYEHFLPHKAEICCIIAVSVRMFVCPSVSQQSTGKLVRHRDLSDHWTSAPVGCWAAASCWAAVRCLAEAGCWAAARHRAVAPLGMMKVGVRVIWMTPKHLVLCVK